MLRQRLFIFGVIGLLAATAVDADAGPLVSASGLPAIAAGNVTAVLANLANG